MDNDIGAKPKHRSWTMGPGPSGPIVKCYKSKNDRQDILPFEGDDGPPPIWEAASPTPFHDETLIEATKEINEILRRCQEYADPPTKTLSTIDVLGRYLLVWADESVVSDEDDLDTIVEALKLQPTGTEARPT